MNGFRGMPLTLLVLATAVAVCHGDVQTSTPCSLSFYRYLFNLPGEQIRPNVPEGTYVFGKRVGPASPEGQASDFRPSVLKPASSFEAPQYLPPVVVQSTTTTTTTTVAPKPSTSAPLYIPPPPPTPPPSPYYPGEASNTISVVQPAKPACQHPEHRTIESGLVPPYRVEPLPRFEPQPTFFVPKFVPLPQRTVPSASENDVQYAVKPVAAPVHRYPVPTPPPRFLRPYIAPVPTPAEDCDKQHRPEPTATAPLQVPVTSTTVEPLVETRQNEIVVLPDVIDAPQQYKSDCTGHKQQQQQQNVVVESLGVPSTDYGVVSAPLPQVPSASAGYSYDKPSQPLPYPSNTVAGGGYAYPKPSPSFEYPAGAGPYAAQASALFESESSPKSSAAGGTEDGDLVVLKV